MQDTSKFNSLFFYTKGLNDSETRDKLLKLFQYSSLLASWYQIDDEQLRYQFMYKKFTESRRLLRLFKSIILLPTVTALLKNPQKSFSRYSSTSLFITNICYFMFYFLDNISILTKLKVLNFLKYSKTKYSAYYTLSVGLASALIYYLVLLRKSYIKESELKNFIQNMTPKDFCEHVAKLSEDRKTYALSILKLICQGTTVFHKAKIPESVLNTRFNEGFVAICGMLSAFISLVQSKSYNPTFKDQTYYV